MHRLIIESLGIIREAKSSFRYSPYSDEVVVLLRKEIERKSNVYNFESSYDPIIGDKIILPHGEFKIIDKKYSVDGKVEYFVENFYEKCENYDEIYAKEKEHAIKYYNLSSF